MVKDFEVMRLRLKLTDVKTHIDFWGVGRLSDYRTSLFLKGKRLFHTKNTRLFADDSQENATTIPRLFYWRNYDYWLRLFQKLLRLFQPERRDYC